MKNKRSAAFSLFAYGKYKIKYQIRFRVSFNGQRIDLSTGCQLSSPLYRDDEKELVKPGYTGPKGETDLTINDELRKAKDQMDMVFKYFENVQGAYVRHPAQKAGAGAEEMRSEAKGDFLFISH